MVGVPDGEIKQRRAVATGRVQIRDVLRRRANAFRVVSDDRLRDGKQRRLIAKSLFPGAEVFPPLRGALLVCRLDDAEPDHEGDDGQKGDLSR